MNITLKAKHLYFIASVIGAYPTDDSSDLWQQIKAVTAGKDDNDYCTVNADVLKIRRIYLALSEKPEGQVNMINTEMNEILMPQILEATGQGDGEAIELAGYVQAIRQGNWDITAFSINSYKEKLHS